jgi:hypothetical protein
VVAIRHARMRQQREMGGFSSSAPQLRKVMDHALRL